MAMISARPHAFFEGRGNTVAVGQFVKTDSGKFYKAPVVDSSGTTICSVCFPTDWGYKLKSDGTPGANADILILLPDGRTAEKVDFNTFDSRRKACLCCDPRFVSLKCDGSRFTRLPSNPKTTVQMFKTQPPTYMAFVMGAFIGGTACLGAACLPCFGGCCCNPDPLYTIKLRGVEVGTVRRTGSGDCGTKGAKFCGTGVGSVVIETGEPEALRGALLIHAYETMCCHVQPEFDYAGLWC